MVKKISAPRAMEKCKNRSWWNPDHKLFLCRKELVQGQMEQGAVLWTCLYYLIVYRYIEDLDICNINRQEAINFSYCLVCLITNGLLLNNFTFWGFFLIFFFFYCCCPCCHSCVFCSFNFIKATFFSPLERFFMSFTFDDFVYIQCY